MNAFETTIKDYLDNIAAQDKHFAERYSDEEKNIEDCCDYIIAEVKKTKRQGFSDDEIYQMARHYYLEEVGDIERTSATVVVNRTIENLKKEKVKKVKEDGQLSLFDLSV